MNWLETVGGQSALSGSQVQRAFYKIHPLTQPGRDRFSNIEPSLRTRGDRFDVDQCPRSQDPLGTCQIYMMKPSGWPPMHSKCEYGARGAPPKVALEGCTLASYGLQPADFTLQVRSKIALSQNGWIRLNSLPTVIIQNTHGH